MNLDVPISGELEGYAEDATEALVRFDSELGGEIAPFASLLLRSEAVASSQIEHRSASARQILTAEIGAKAKPNATMIVAKTAAMRSALDLADKLETTSILRMHEVLIEKQQRDARRGRWLYPIFFVIVTGVYIVVALGKPFPDLGLLPWAGVALFAIVGIYTPFETKRTLGRIQRLRSIVDEAPSTR